MNFFSLKFEFFYKNHHLTRHVKLKLKKFSPSNTSIMPNKIPLTNLERLLRLINLRLGVYSAKYIAR